MTSRDFCFWLQGFFEIAGPQAEIGAHEVTLIRNHLNLVFKHEIDPSMPDPDGSLQATHDGLVTTEHHEAVKAEYDSRIETLSTTVKNLSERLSSLSGCVPPGPMRC